MVRSRLYQDKQARLECQSTCSYIHSYNTDTSQWRTVPKDSFTKYLPLLFRHFCTVGTWLFVVHIKAFWLNGDSVGGKYTNLGSINNLATVLTVLVYWILLCVNYCLNANYEGEGQLDVIKINKNIKGDTSTFDHTSTIPDRVGICRKCWFPRAGENRSSWRKTARSREENQPQTKPTNNVFLRKELQGKKEGITGTYHTTNVPNADMTTAQTTPP